MDCVDKRRSAWRSRPRPGQALLRLSSLTLLRIRVNKRLPRLLRIRWTPLEPPQSIGKHWRLSEVLSLSRCYLDIAYKTSSRFASAYLTIRQWPPASIRARVRGAMRVVLGFTQSANIRFTSKKLSKQAIETKKSVGHHVNKYLFLKSINICIWIEKVKKWD